MIRCREKLRRVLFESGIEEYLVGRVNGLYENSRRACNVGRE